ncbi:nuclear prelamin A recognition factor isoform X8 [Symphalangus syndactylus]|uniref:nuclear prelamin A recognition factor isoform X8 n=1 Tax=Symphalangus syndactylus TaxID=9590 RepID=UPI003004F468
MKCEHCTRKECSKKTKTDDQENVSADALSPAQENGEKGEFHKLADAKIFLSDCLACDSCMTAEEGVQLSQQNAKDFFRVLNLNKFHRLYRRHGWGGLRKQSWRKSEGEASTSSRGSRREQVKGEKCDTSKHKVLVVSVCPQSLPYFAAKFNLSVTDASRRLCGFLKSLGWVRYAERVLGCPITAHLCTARSPQQVMGSLVKDYFARQQNLSPEKIFHVIVAPCYDKKLEALQESLPPALHGSRGADCVLTSGEIAQIMEQGDLSVKDAAVDTLNKDFQEVTLEKNGEVVLRFAAAYGFRNIQNMILKLKKGKFPYHFVEVLACAGGCLNGRGQAQTPDGHADKALLRQMEGIYADIPVRRPESSAHVQELYQEWLEGINSPKAREVLHTTYQSQERGAHSLDIKW